MEPFMDSHMNEPQFLSHLVHKFTAEGLLNKAYISCSRNQQAATLKVKAAVPSKIFKREITWWHKLDQLLLAEDKPIATPSKLIHL